MANKDTLDEYWGDYNNHISWDANGFFSLTETNPEKTYSAFGGGTYIYEPATEEIFAQIDQLNEKQAVCDKTTYKCSWKRYFKIIERNDSTVVVRTIPPEYEIDWGFDATGKRQLIFLDTIDHLPFIIITYKRISHGSDEFKNK